MCRFTLPPTSISRQSPKRIKARISCRPCKRSANSGRAGRWTTDLHAPLYSDIPALLLSGEADPVTPPRDAERLAAGLTHHRILLQSGEGHGQLGTGCMPRVMAAFLDAASTDKLDAGCLERHTVEPFFISMTGPSP